MFQHRHDLQSARVSLVRPCLYTVYSNVKLTAGAGWDRGRATSPPVHEGDGLAAQLRP